MLLTNQILTGQTGRVEQENEQWITIPARRMCNDSCVKIWEQEHINWQRYAQRQPWDDRAVLILERSLRIRTPSLDPENDLSSAPDLTVIQVAVYLL